MSRAAAALAARTAAHTDTAPSSLSPLIHHGECSSNEPNWWSDHHDTQNGCISTAALTGAALTASPPMGARG